jgi:hypothetical protein
VIAALVASAQMTQCGRCWAQPGSPCGDGFDHLERYQRACRRGLISHSELQRAVGLCVTASGVQIVRHADSREL